MLLIIILFLILLSLVKAIQIMRLSIPKTLIGTVFGSVLLSIPFAIAGNAQTTPTAQPATPPLPEQQVAPTGIQVQPINGRVTVRLVNETYAPITYQAIGDTSPRTLAGRTSITLRNLRAPSTLTFDREDFGLLRVQPRVVSTDPGVLEVRLSETTNLAVDRTALRVEANGAVSLN